MNWVCLCKRTNDPKLAYIEYLLDNAGITSRRNGESFHAPILEVDARYTDDAWGLLEPIDDVDDVDERFLGAENLRDAQRAAYDECAELRKAALNHRGEP